MQVEVGNISGYNGFIQNYSDFSWEKEMAGGES